MSSGSGFDIVRGVRGRSAAAAVLVVAVALGLGAAVFLVVLQNTLVSSVQRAAVARAEQVAAQLERDGASSARADLAQSTLEGQLVQVLDPSDQVMAASSARAEVGPLSDARPAPGESVAQTTSLVPLLDDDDPYLVAVAAGPGSAGGYRVVVATSIAAAQQSVAASLKLFAIGLPIVLVLVGASTWWLVGRALGPVERIRARVSAISGTRVSQRIPVPDSRDEIAALAVTMNEMLARLESAQATQRRFVADASHELRSPLATLNAAVQVAVADETGATWQGLAEVMTAETNRMSRLVEDLLLLSKVDEHSMRLEWQDVDLDDVLQGQAARLRATPRVTVSTQIVPVRIEGDPGKLAQCVTNVVDNAVRHARSRVGLSLGPGPDGDSARIVVDDDGTGIPENERVRVLERFVRLDDSRSRNSGGSGLGLSIASEVARAHGGGVEIGTSPWGGTRVTLWIPTRQVDGER